MQALQKLAGVQEASDPTIQPAAPVTQPAPLPPPKDGELDSRQKKRASLPLNRRASRRSLRSTRSGRSSSNANQSVPNLPPDYPPTPRLPPEHQQGPLRPSADTHRSSLSEEGDEEFAWGPSHPCFPHPNPHCLPNSPEFQATRVIRVKRDWLATGDLYPQYANLYPEILDPLVSDSEFRTLISKLNAICQRTFSPLTTRAWVDSLLGAFTGFVWEDLGVTGAKKGERELERFIDEWNREKEKEGLEVRLVQLRRTGFTGLDFVVPDPGIDYPGEGEEEDEAA